MLASNRYVRACMHSTDILYGNPTLPSPRLGFVPRFHQSEMEMLQVTSEEDLSTLPTNKWGIKQPASETDIIKYGWQIMINI